MANQIEDRSARKDRVGIEGDDDLALRLADAPVERRGLASVVLTQQRDLRMIAE